MKTRVLGWACAASMAAGCQSAAMSPLSRWSSDDSTSVQTVADKSSRSDQTAGLPGPSARNSQPANGRSAIELAASGRAALAEYYKDPQASQEALQRARVQYEAAAAADPTSAKSQHMLAIIADNQERYSDAEKYYLAALSLDPGNGNICADLGFSYLLQQKWMPAERYLNQAIQIDPKNTKAVEHLAEVYVGEGQPQLAERTLLQAFPRDQAQALLASLSSPPAGRNGAAAPASSSQPRDSAPQNAQQDLMARMEQARQQSIAARQSQAAANAPAQALPQDTLSNTQFRWANSNQQPLQQSRPQQQPMQGDPRGEMLRQQLAAIDNEGRSRNEPMVIPGRRGVDTADLRTSQNGMADPRSMANSQPSQMSSGGYGPGAGNRNGVEQASGEELASDAPALPDFQNRQPYYDQQPPRQNPFQAYENNREAAPAAEQSSQEQYGQTDQRMPEQSRPNPFTSQQQPAYGASSPGTTLNSSNGGEQWPTIQPGASSRSPQAGLASREPAERNAGSWTSGQTGASADGATPARGGMPSALPQRENPQAGSQAAFSNHPIGQQSGASAAEFARSAPPLNLESEQQQPSDASSPSAFEQARRKAALMGLGVGGGAAFSTFEPSAPRMSAGSNSNWNGAAYTPPERQMPTMTAQPELRQHPIYSDDSTMQMAPPPNSLGQQMPSTSPVVHPMRPSPFSRDAQWAEAPPAQVQRTSSGDAPWANEAVNNAMQPYHDSRQRVDQSLQQSMDTAWGNRPAQAIASPTAGVEVQRPESAAQQMERWNPQTVIPAEYPAAGGAGSQNRLVMPMVTPANGSQSRISTTGVPTSGQPTYAPGVEVPPPYYSNR